MIIFDGSFDINIGKKNPRFIDLTRVSLEFDINRFGGREDDIGKEFTTSIEDIFIVSGFVNKVRKVRNFNPNEMIFFFIEELNFGTRFRSDDKSMIQRTDERKKRF